MGTHFFCEAYNDMEAGLDCNNGVIFLTLSAEDLDLHLIVSPIQAMMLGSAMRSFAKGLTIGEVNTSKFYGDMKVRFASHAKADEVAIAKVKPVDKSVA